MIIQAGLRQICAAQDVSDGPGVIQNHPSVVPHCGEQLCLSPVVEELLVNVVADGFTLYRCGSAAVPSALIACYEWDYYVDLFTVWDFERVIAARAPRRGAVDIFAPQVVVWAYEGLPQHAIRALLDLVHPGHPDAPSSEYPAPARLHIPRAQQRPMTIRLPSPGRAGVRAARLARALPTLPGAAERQLTDGGASEPPTLGSRRPADYQPPLTSGEVSR